MKIAQLGPRSSSEGSQGNQRFRAATGFGMSPRGPVSLWGFTLIELMVVLALMAILAAAVIPQMRGTHDDELLRAAARDLAGAMKLAYSQAVTEHGLHRLVLDEKHEHYRVEKRAPAEENGYKPARHAQGGEGRLDPRVKVQIQEIHVEDQDQEELAQDLRIGEEPRRSAKDSVEFYPDGTAEAKEILLRDREGFGLALRVNPATARVTFVELGRGN